MYQNVKDPVPGDTFGVPVGIYVGEIFCFVEKVGENYQFLSMPKMLIRTVPKEKFEFAIYNNIIEFIENLPRDVYKLVEAQYNQNK
jgi:hypothetical protein